MVARHLHRLHRLGLRRPGRAGIDLGTLRLDAALYYGPAAPDEILRGWQQQAGRLPENLAYWDIVAALTTVGDMADCLPPLADHGRNDLDAPTLTSRRDAFLQAALTTSTIPNPVPLRQPGPPPSPRSAQPASISVPSA